MPTSLTRLSSCLSSILSCLECPVCFEVIPPPAHQCPLGHVICFKCHAYTDKCPVCRTRYNKDRSLLSDKIYESMIEAFQLKSQPIEIHSRKLWDRLFGKKKRQQQQQKIENLHQKINSIEIKNKFLSRLTGKASSVDNLSYAGAASSLLSKNDSPYHRKKSLSSNELFFRPSRAHSNCSSYNGSMISLLNHHPSGSSGNSNVLYKCPCDQNCMHLSTSQEIVYHMQETHNGPILQYFQNEFILKFPLSFSHLTIITMFCYEKLFFVKIFQDSNGGDIKVHIWMLSSKEEASNFRAIGTIFQPDNDQNTELTFKTFIHPLEVNNSLCALYEDQIIITKGVMDAYFRGNSFSLSVSIVSMT